MEKARKEANNNDDVSDDLRNEVQLARQELNQALNRISGEKEKMRAEYLAALER